MKRLNHAVLYVRDAERSAAFYETVLGFERLSMGAGLKGAVFMRAGGSTKTATGVRGSPPLNR